MLRRVVALTGVVVVEHIVVEVSEVRGIAADEDDILWLANVETPTLGGFGDCAADDAEYSLVNKKSISLAASGR